VVLAGGASRRLGGTPKGLEPVGDARLIDRVASALRSVVPEIVLSANDPNAGGWIQDGGEAVRALPDLHPNAGGLAGVDAALALGRDVLAVAWDMPFVNQGLLAAILTAARSLDADVVVPESFSPHRIEPFCAFYSQRVREPLSQFLEFGGGAAHQFIERLRGVYRLPLADVRRHGDPKMLFFSVNTPDDLERARAIIDPAK
jgi:molybdopterin-guanine dinucleotide biosynthesis protein A